MNYKILQGKLKIEQTEHNKLFTDVSCNETCHRFVQAILGLLPTNMLGYCLF